MLIKKQKIIILAIIVILTFIIGILYELDYRILTRRVVKFFADNKLEFYGGKDFRIFETDIAFILTLIPIGFYLTARKISSIRKILFLNFTYLILIPIFYLFFCYLESQFIKITVTESIINGGIIKYHQNNVNYRIILILTMLTTFVSGLIFKKIVK